MASEFVDFTLLEKIKKKRQERELQGQGFGQGQSNERALDATSGESESGSGSFLGFSNLAAFTSPSQGSQSEMREESTESIQYPQYQSSNFVEQKLLEIYERLNEIYESIEEIKRKLK
ncbi:MAG: hypothetical protein QW403_03365, partial [Candidatus Aenigmatarchaeota archaeon]